MNTARSSFPKLKKGWQPNLICIAPQSGYYVFVLFLVQEHICVSLFICCHQGNLFIFRPNSLGLAFIESLKQVCLRYQLTYQVQEKTLSYSLTSSPLNRRQTPKSRTAKKTSLLQAD